MKNKIKDIGHGLVNVLFAVGVLNVLFAVGGIYALGKIWFGDWRRWEDTIFCSLYQWWISHWIIWSTIGFGLIAAIGLFSLAVVSWDWLEKRKLKRKIRQIAINFGIYHQR